MNKILKHLFLLIMVYTVLPLNVLADCGIGFVNVKATISNQEGAKLYKWEKIDGDKYGYVLTNETLNYGEEVTIQYESKGYASIEKAGGNYYIKSSDYSHKGDTKAESENYIKYYAYAETIVRNVPSFYSYDVVTKIPANTYFDISGSDNYVSSSDGKWSVAKYNGKTGWVYKGGCSLEDEPITIANKYEKPLDAYALGSYDYSSGKYNDVTEGYTIIGDDSTKKNISIKYGEKVKILYKHRVGHNMFQYIKTDSIDGIWVYNTAFYVETDKNVVFRGLEYEKDGKKYNTYVVKDFKSFSSNDSKLEENKLYNYKYEIINVEESGYVVELNGSLSWILAESKSGLGITELEKETLSIDLDNDYKYYSNYWFDDNTKEEGIIKKGQYTAYRLYDKNIINYNSTYYVEGYGFISYDKPVQSQETIKEDKNKDNTNETIVDVSNSPQMYVMYCIYGAIALTVVAAIIIITLHGRKKKEDKIVEPASNIDENNEKKD